MHFRTNKRKSTYSHRLGEEAIENISPGRLVHGCTDGARNMRACLSKRNCLRIVHTQPCMRSQHSACCTSGHAAGWASAPGPSARTALLCLHPWPCNANFWISQPSSKCPASGLVRAKKFSVMSRSNADGRPDGGGAAASGTDSARSLELKELKELFEARVPRSRPRSEVNNSQ